MTTGERTGVKPGDAIYAMPPDVSLLDLVGRRRLGSAHGGRRFTGRGGGSARRGYAGVGATRARRRSGDSLCFLDHMHLRKRWGAAKFWILLVPHPGVHFACPSTVLGQTIPPHPEARGRTSN